MWKEKLETQKFVVENSLDALCSFTWDFLKFKNLLKLGIKKIMMNQFFKDCDAFHYLKKVQFNQFNFIFWIGIDFFFHKTPFKTWFST